MGQTGALSREAAAAAVPGLESAAASRLTPIILGRILGLTPKSICCRRFATPKFTTSKLTLRVGKSFPAGRLSTTDYFVLRLARRFSNRKSINYSREHSRQPRKTRKFPESRAGIEPRKTLFRARREMGKRTRKQAQPRISSRTPLLSCGSCLSWF